MIVGASAHGSPGVTTSLSLMAATWPGRPPVLIEADVAGGVMGARFQLGQSPGFGSLATALRYDSSFELLDHCQGLPSGVPVVVGSTAASTAITQLRNSASALGSYLHDRSETCLVDAGSLMPWGPMVDGIRDADLLLWFVRPTGEELRLLHTRLEEIPPTLNTRMVLIGEEPYSAAEVQAAFPVEVFDVLPIDTRAATAANFGGGDRHLQRSALVRASRSLALKTATALGLPEVSQAREDSATRKSRKERSQEEAREETEVTS